jgi:hypothetical protein
VVGHLRERFPRVRIRLRGDSHYACPEVMSWCEARGIEYIFGLSGTAPLAAQVQTLEARTAARYAARRAAEPPKFKLRRYMDFRGSPGTASAGSLPGSKRGPMGSTPATSSPTWPGAAALRAKILPERENLLKLHLASASCTRACANQVRLFLHGAAYWLLWTFQSLMPKRSPWRQFDTLRNRLIKLVTEVTETADRIRIALAPVFPVEDILTVVSTRLARFVTWASGHVPAPRNPSP